MLLQGSLICSQDPPLQCSTVHRKCTKARSYDHFLADGQKTHANANVYERSRLYLLRERTSAVCFC